MAQQLQDHADAKSQTTPASDVGVGSTVIFPPGTVRLEETNNSAHEGIILQPRPTEDPNDPLNWPNWRKYLNFGIVGFYVLLVSEFINSATPTWGPMQRELGFSDQVLTASYAIGCAFLAIGAIILVPFALKFGRRPLYISSSLVQCGVSIWSAKLQNVADLLLVNVLCAGFGALAEVIVQMTIADMFFVHQRGTFNSIYIWLWQVAVSLGPFIAGYITVGQGWRWVWWWNAVFFGVFFVLACFCYEDTKYCPGSWPSPISQGTEEGPKSSADPSMAGPTTVSTEEGSPHDIYVVRINHDIPVKTYRQRLAITTPSSSGGIKSFLGHMYQPLVLLTTIPAIAYTALAYGILIALQDIIGDALVGVTIVRNTFSTIFIFAVDPWVHAMGIKWVIITIVLIATGILSLTGVFIRYGKIFRARTAQTYQRYSLLQYKER
ncbi:hypothetical protein LCI18_000871 [Fusarium solani-melongenae]|uniref:Uncharacterized protein n=1 Tax=Fusarium solani subsp. cucurbitae TaxID=2747967 RepID=A0ACD3YLX0_FUSSC|nr:hypothetical protein LCI18_000871 [Fusarium solani-melongenae]